jgi:thioesterase domain-containing protein/non-ribosomal peptide synthetase component F
MIDLSTTPMRRQFEFLTRNGAGPFIFLRQVSISFGEKIDADLVRRAWDVVATATPLLRDATSGADPSAGDSESAEKGICSVLDWRAEDPDGFGDEWNKLLQSDATRGFTGSPMQRIQLVQLPGDTIHVLWTSDARELDYSSLAGTLIRWFAACDLLVSGHTVEWPLDPDPVGFLAKLKDLPLSEDQDFWKAHLDRFHPPLPAVLFPLPMPDDMPSGAREAITHVFERAERIVFADAGKAIGVPVAAIARAAWSYLIGEVCGTREFLLAEPMEAEADSVLSQTAGRFESWVPRRITLPKTGTVSEYCSSMGAWSMDSARYFDIESIAATVNLLPEELIPTAGFLFREGTLNDTLRRAMPRWMAADVCVYEKATHPLSLLWTDTDRPVVELGYDSAKLSHPAAQSLLARWVQLIRKFVEAPDALIIDTSLLLPAESGVVRGTERTSAVRSLVPQCIHEALNDVATERADQLAIELGVETVLFSKLTSQSNQLARYLQKNGISPGDAVGVAVSRSPLWVISLLGAWKSGAKVVLLSPEDSSAKPPGVELKAVIQDTATARSVQVEDGVKRITVDSGWSAISGEKTRAVSVAADHSAPALIYQAGDGSNDWTVLAHDQLLAATLATAEVLGLGCEDRLLQFAPVDLPAAVEEMLVALLSGGTLVLRPDDVLSTRTAFHEFVTDTRITALLLPSAFLGQWLHYLTELSTTVSPVLRVVAAVGWRVLPSQFDAWEKAAASIPLLHVTPNDGLIGLGFVSENIPLGSNYAPVEARIVNPAGIALPPGFCGRVESAWSPIAEAGEKVTFKPTPHTAFRIDDGRFLGRKWVDAELGNFSSHDVITAIEWVASQHPGISTAVAAAREVDGHSQFCVWIVPQDTVRGEPLDFRSFLTARLPAHLIPGCVGCLQRLPLTRSSEVDFSALPEPHAGVPDAADKRERGTDDEELLRSVLGKVLGGRPLRLDEMIRDGKARLPVAQSLCDAVRQSGFASELSDFIIPFSIRSLCRNIRSRRPLMESGWVPLRPLRMSGSLPPLVLIHDFGGTSRVCESLAAALGDDQPCYAITARGLAEPSKAHKSIEEMAKSYVEAIKIMDPEGPHGIIGVGFGGLVAFECAKILTAEGITPRILVVLRTEPPIQSAAMRGFRALSRNLLKSFRGATRPDASASRSTNSVTEINHEAAAKFSPQDEAGFSMHAFIPEQDFASFREVQSGWNSVCSGVNFYQVPCTAQELLEEPAITAVGDAIVKLVQAGELADEIEDDDDDNPEEDNAPRS